MRAAGILMHISSLPSPYGIGALGSEAYEFVDFLTRAGQAYWQILPVCPPGSGNSPYQSFSSFAGYMNFIDLELLRADGYLLKNEYASINWGTEPTRTDYALLDANREQIMRLAASRMNSSDIPDFEGFCDNNPWLDEYSLYMALKREYNGKPWYKWPAPLKFRSPSAVSEARERLANDIRFYKIIQYVFFSQWKKLRNYANEKGIRLIGDLPIYVSYDSADVWSEPDQFYLDSELNMIDVAGCPPDKFTAAGQLWGNPLYRWDRMKEDGYSWWCKRFRHAISMFDYTRIDHFRGFDSYYAISANAKDARSGEWREGPGLSFFSTVEKSIGAMPFIAEDLGYVTSSVKQLLADTGFPGMKILQFAFSGNENSDHLPHNYQRNDVVYTGTHDNSTLSGWINSASAEELAYAERYLRLRRSEGFRLGMIKSVWASVCDTAIIQMQDLLGLDDSARMNIPSKVGGNWEWRALKKQLSNRLADEINNFMQLYGR